MVARALNSSSRGPAIARSTSSAGLAISSRRLRKELRRHGRRGERRGAARAGERRQEWHRKCPLQVANLATEERSGMATGTYDLVLLEPPRAGAREVLPVAARSRPRASSTLMPRGTFARDAGILVEQRVTGGRRGDHGHVSATSQWNRSRCSSRRHDAGPVMVDLTGIALERTSAR